MGLVQGLPSVCIRSVCLPAPFASTVFALAVFAGVRARVRCARVRCARLRRARVRYARVRCTRLRWARLRWARLRWVGLRWVGLRWVGLRWVGLRWVGLCCARPAPPAQPVTKGTRDAGTGARARQTVRFERRLRTRSLKTSDCARSSGCWSPRCRTGVAIAGALLHGVDVVASCELSQGSSLIKQLHPCYILAQRPAS